MSEEALRQRDAQAFVALAEAASRAHCREGCADFAAPGRELAQRSAALQATADALRSGLHAHALALQQHPAQIADGLRQLRGHTHALQPPWGPTEDDLIAWAAALQQAAEARLEALRPLLRRHGLDEHAAATASAAAGAEPAAALSNPATAALSAHARHWIAAWNTEPEAFGAYTYVLMRSPADAATPAARARLARLLAQVGALPAAADVPDAARARLNLFVLPGDEDRGYDARLGWQIALRAQGGILVQRDLLRALVSAPGPFLVTLPVRMAQARGDTPLLFADLSALPPQTIGDIAQQYMGGLLESFPTQQQQWRPPVALGVALWMVRVGGQVGQLVQDVFPAAQAAAPAPPPGR